MLEVPPETTSEASMVMLPPQADEKTKNNG
jgi:hypothetical protein